MVNVESVNDAVRFAANQIAGSPDVSCDPDLKRAVGGLGSDERICLRLLVRALTSCFTVPSTREGLDPTLLS